MYIMCVMLVQHFEPQGRRFTNVHFIIIITLNHYVAFMKLLISRLSFLVQTAEDSPSAESSPVTESYEIVKNSAAATSDASPNSEVSSPSSFEQIGGDQGREVEQEDAGENTDEGEGGEDILLDQQEDKTEEEESGVRHRKSGHTEQL